MDAFLADTTPSPADGAVTHLHSDCRLLSHPGGSPAPPQSHPASLPCALGWGGLRPPKKVLNSGPSAPASGTGAPAALLPHMKRATPMLVHGAARSRSVRHPGAEVASLANVS